MSRDRNHYYSVDLTHFFVPKRRRKAMTVTDQPLVKVKTLSAKMAKQIRTVNFDTAPNGPHMQLYNACLTTPPLGWARRDAVFGHGYDRLWLVQNDNGLFWMMAPEKGPVLEMYPNLPQLFIG